MRLRLLSLKPLAPVAVQPVGHVHDLAVVDAPTPGVVPDRCHDLGVIIRADVVVEGCPGLGLARLEAVSVGRE